MRAPGFWQAGGDAWPSRLLSPLERITAAATAARLARPGWTAPVPVICCGNVTSGGAGKTTLALDLGVRLVGRGIAVHFLSRGYGGRHRGVTRVNPTATAAEVGDEPLLLAAVAPTWVGADRAAAARAAVAHGASALIMDDGLQNPGLQKSLSLLVIDGRSGFGNGRLLPAGPLRERPATAAARCQAAVLIGEDQHQAVRALPADLPILRARLRPGPRTLALAGTRVLAFAGIADPTKFFATLSEAGVIIERSYSFADHHAYREHELTALLRQAKQHSLTLVTTSKDAVRLPDPVRSHVQTVDIVLQWTDAAAINALLDQALRTTDAMMAQPIGSR